jgi:acyl transferase domain-containing protein
VPGAADHHQFWHNLLNGHESVALLSAEELATAGIAAELRQHPNYVPARLTIEDKDCFDPAFFNISPRAATYMDPQARLLLLHAWKAMEDAGLAVGDNPETGVFMSAATNFYQLPLGLPVHALQGADGHAAGLQAQGGMIPNTISYHLGLQGPSVFVQALCSSSLVGLKLACQSLQAGEAKLALVGAASLFALSRVGYLYEPGLNLSADGHCRTFDAAATGMVEGEGVCVIVLKKALQALADGDHIYALLRGISLNNDGADKAGFHAPGVKGQAAAARAVLSATGVDPTTIGYIEAHGTGTPSGDAIEVAALSEAYQHRTNRCAIGALKPNIGNLDTAGGLAGVIKVALCLYHGTIPPQINFSQPAPDIDFTNAPFYVTTRVEPWQDAQAPRRAAQNHYSLGGTNVHAIYEAVAPVPPSPAAAGPFLVPLSARDDDRLREMVHNLSAFLQRAPAPRLSELAYTLQVGRVAMLWSATTRNA